MSRPRPDDLRTALARSFGFGADRERLERIRRAVLDPARLTVPLADEIAVLLRGHPSGLSASEVASRLSHRKARVAALRADRRFAQAGNRRGTRFRLADAGAISGREPTGTGHEPIGGDGGASPDSSAVPAIADAQPRNEGRAEAA